MVSSSPSGPSAGDRIEVTNRTAQIRYENLLRQRDSLIQREKSLADRLDALNHTTGQETSKYRKTEAYLTIVQIDLEEMYECIQKFKWE